MTAMINYFFDQFSRIVLLPKRRVGYFRNVQHVIEEKSQFQCRLVIIRSDKQRPYVNS